MVCFKKYITFGPWSRYRKIPPAAQCCQMKFLNIHEWLFEMFTKSLRIEIVDRNTSETVGIYGNHYMDYYINGI